MTINSRVEFNKTVTVSKAIGASNAGQLSQSEEAKSAGAGGPDQANRIT